MLTLMSRPAGGQLDSDVGWHSVVVAGPMSVAQVAAALGAAGCLVVSEQSQLRVAVVDADASESHAMLQFYLASALAGAACLVKDVPLAADIRFVTDLAT